MVSISPAPPPVHQSMIIPSEGLQPAPLRPGAARPSVVLNRPAPAAEPARARGKCLALGTRLPYTPLGMRATPRASPDPEKARLVRRLSRICAQADALRRATDGFVVEAIRDRIRAQMVNAKDRKEASRAAEDLIGIARSCLT